MSGLLLKPEPSHLLPITQHLPKIISQLQDKPNLVLQAEPGAGKSTALPLALLNGLDIGGKKILLLEPRRVAVKAIAYYLAKQLGEPVGQRVGYQIKNERKVSSETVLEIVTEGILTRRLQQDPELNEIGLVIFDEFHERSIHSDLSLMLCLEVQQAFREDLKLLLMSATIDTTMLSDYLDNAPVIECEGRAFPVELSYRPATNTNEYLDKQVLSALKLALANEDQGDILVFLPGQGEIRRCLSSAQHSFQQHKDLAFLPLYGGLTLKQQEQALQADKTQRRKVIFATNIAETSLTIEGITWVIDSGLERQMVYAPGSGMSRLETKYISKASAEQRKGRAGRVKAGQCIRLWSESQQQGLRDFQSEEINISDLCSLVLELCVWGSNDYENTPWLSAPPKAHYDAARDVLLELGLLEASGQVTARGKLAAKLPVHPRLANMLLSCQSAQEQRLTVDIATLVSEQDILIQDRHVDLTKRLNALQAFRVDKDRALANWHLNRMRAEQVLRSTQSIYQQLSRQGSNIESSNEKALAELLLCAFPDRLAKQRSSGNNRYLMANGKGAFLYEDDSLFDEPWLVIIDCDAQKKEGRIYSAVAIDQVTALKHFSGKVSEEDRFYIDPGSQKIKGDRKTLIGAIEIDSSPISEIPSDAFNRCLKQLIKKQGLTILNWSKACDEWLARANWLGQQLSDFPQLSHQALVEEIDTWLLPYLTGINSMKALKGVNVFELLKSCLDWDQQNRLEKEAPTHYLTPGNKQVPITYDEHQGPTVSVILQEVFGELSSPTLAEGKVPLRFELLSPARRPIQTTSDLANFWNTSYFEVAKDMKGRYPKHRWPDKPLEEKAGRSIKSLK